MIGRSEKCFNPVGIIAVLGWFFLGICGFCGCVKPPVKEIADAEVALGAARSSGAEKYVREDYKHVLKKVGEARLRVKEHRYKIAKSLALECAEEARRIKFQTESIKAKMKKEAENSLTVAHKAICELEEQRAIQYDIEEYVAILDLFRKIQKEYDEQQYSKVIEIVGSITQRCKSLEKRIQERRAKQKMMELRREEVGKGKELEQKKKVDDGGKKDAEKTVKHSEHVVRVGDSLWKICQEPYIYKNPFIWPIIYKANRSQIRDPDLIYPGQKFIIPRHLVEEAIGDAASEARNRGPWSLYDNK